MKRALVFNIGPGPAPVDLTDWPTVRGQIGGGWSRARWCWSLEDFLARQRPEDASLTMVEVMDMHARHCPVL